MNSKKDILSAKDFDRKYLERLFELTDLLLPYSRIPGYEKDASFIRERYSEIRDMFAGYVLGTIFIGEGNESASTRTRESFELAMRKLGGISGRFKEEGSSREKGESWERTLRNLDNMYNLTVMRVGRKYDINHFASFFRGPVINGGNGSDEHPTQWLIDGYYLNRHFGNKGGIDNKRIAFIGDPSGRVFRSGAYGLGNFDGVKIMVVNIPECPVPDDLKGRVHEIVPMEKRHEALNDFKPDALYFLRVQTNVGSTGAYSIGLEDIEKLPKDAIWMHAQPIPKSEIPEEFEKDPRQHWYQQGACHIPVRMAAITERLGHADDIEWLFK